MFDALYSPALKATALQPNEAKQLQDYMDVAKQMFTAIDGGSFGIIAPAAGQNGFMRGYFIYEGDAQAIMAAHRKMWTLQDVFMKAMNQPGIEMKFSQTPDAIKVDGVSLDAYTMKFTVDPTRPEAMMVQPMLNIMYGGDEVKMYIGAVDAKRVLATFSVDENQVKQAIASAKAGQPLKLQGAQAADAGLPKNRTAVSYVYLDRVFAFGMDVARRMAGGSRPSSCPRPCRRWA